MSLLRLPAFLPLVLALLAGCSSPPPQGVSATGALQLAVYAPTAVPADVSRVTVTVSGSDMTSLTTELVVTDGVWGGIISGIPAGPGRTFLAQAFTSSNTLRYEGRAEDVTVTAGTTGLVSITLQEVSPPPPFTNEAPLVDSLVASVTTVAPGGSVSLSATAHDPNPGDTLTFAWTAPSGSFSTPGQASTSWTAPGTQGPVTLSLVVTDSRGASLTVSVTVNVSAGSGAEEVKVGFNTAPKLVTLSSTQSLLDVGQQTALSVSATDADGDTLSYQWTATCSGTFTGASTTSATFTPSALPTAACNNCQLNVVVTDGHGGRNTGSLALCVAKAPSYAPPTISRSYQSSLTARASQQLTFEVGATDPAGSALSFAWTANVGTLGTASTGANSSRITWTAPTCVSTSTTPSLTATVTNAFSLKTTRSFTVTGLPACATSGWTATGSMGTARFNHTATLLPNGKVLVAGGSVGGSRLATAELYDPATGTWSPTGSMLYVRSFHTATLLPTGKVLVAGGGTGSQILSTAELYDPATGTWSSTGSMSTWHDEHSATLLPNGKVLLAGGDSYPYRVTELYNPATGTWSPAGTMSADRILFMTALLPDGRVLLAGGVYSSVLPTVEVYNPATNNWSSTGSLAAARYSGTATTLSTGKVLVAGGYNNSTFLATVELYDPATGTWSAASPMSSPRRLHTATTLSTGKVLISGGSSGSSTLKTAELYDPATGTWSATGSLTAARHTHTATLLSDGRVLVVGGSSGGAALATAEVYDPGPSP